MTQEAKIRLNSVPIIVDGLIEEVSFNVSGSHFFKRSLELMDSNRLTQITYARAAQLYASAMAKAKKSEDWDLYYAIWVDPPEYLASLGFVTVFIKDEDYVIFQESN